MSKLETGPLCKPAFMKVVVSDAEEAAKFYIEAFGMARTETLDLEPLVEIFLELPGSAFALVIVAYKRPFDISAGNNWGPIGFETDDLDALLKRAVDAGAAIAIPAGTINDLRYVIVKSPQGHEIELIQRLAP